MYICIYHIYIYIYQSIVCGCSDLIRLRLAHVPGQNPENASEHQLCQPHSWSRFGSQPTLRA